MSFEDVRTDCTCLGNGTCTAPCCYQHKPYFTAGATGGFGLHITTGFGALADPLLSGAETTPQCAKSANGAVDATPANGCTHSVVGTRGKQVWCDICGTRWTRPSDTSPPGKPSSGAVDATPANGGQEPPQAGEASTDRDPVTRPAHYALSPEPLDVIEAWGLGYHEGNVVKYVTRWRRKNGVEDLRKAAEYLRRLIALVDQ